LNPTGKEHDLSGTNIKKGPRKGKLPELQHAIQTGDRSLGTVLVQEWEKGFEEGRQQRNLRAIRPGCARSGQKGWQLLKGMGLKSWEW